VCSEPLWRRGAPGLVPSQDRSKWARAHLGPCYKLTRLHCDGSDTWTFFCCCCLQRSVRCLPLPSDVCLFQGQGYLEGSVASPDRQGHLISDAVVVQNPQQVGFALHRFAVHRGDDISENNVASETPAGRSQTCFGRCAARRNLQRRNI